MRFRYDTDVSREPNMLQPFDRVVIATGAQYRFGLGPLAERFLGLGIAAWPGFRQLFSRDKVRDWFYYRARHATGGNFKRFVRSGQKLVVIGDAALPGKSKAAISSAFEAALLKP